MKTIFLAINHDRHTDDKIIGFKNKTRAIKQCKEWIENYPPERYTFVKRDYGFIFYMDAGEDYSVRVEEVDVLDMEIE